MAKQESNFLNNSFFKELQFGYAIDIDPADLEKMQLRGGKYRIQVKRGKSSGKLYMEDNTYTPPSPARPKPDQGDIWSRAKAAAPQVDDTTDGLPF